ncbi:MAG: alpha/beta fold hydrolase [Anaerolineales bacterium]|nr:alpha/beta fold hydrolase [Anaerolineales bacterium]
MQDKFFIILLCLAGLTLVLILLQRQAKRHKIIVWKLAAFASGLALLVAILAACQLARISALSYIHPTRIPVTQEPSHFGISAYRQVEFLTPDGLLLRGWHIPTRNGAMIILVHGHGGNRTQLLDEAALLSQEGYGVLMYDARNCGESEGQVTTFGLLEANDLRAALDFILDQPGVDADRIAALGHSMGGATVLLAAADLLEIQAVVVESTYANLESNLRAHLDRYTGLPYIPFGPLVIFWGEHDSGVELNQVRPVDVITAISPRPILLVHGALDQVMPVENAYQLYEAASEPKELLILKGAGHCCLARDGGQIYQRRLLEFFRKTLQ